jgi:hypothetical protein
MVGNFFSADDPYSNGKNFIGGIFGTSKIISNFKKYRICSCNFRFCLNGQIVLTITLFLYVYMFSAGMILSI